MYHENFKALKKINHIADFTPSHINYFIEIFHCFFINK